MSGYSPRSLVDKLGLKEGQKALLVQAPSEYGKTLGPLPLGLSLVQATAAKARSESIRKASPFE